MRLRKIASALLVSLVVFVQPSISADIKQMATDKVQNKITETKSNIANKATTFAKDTIQEYIPNTEVSITGMEDAKPQWEIITVQPIRDVGDDLTFFQGSLLRWDGDRDTINLGLGQRRFLMDKTIMIGANAFYDHEFGVDHSRLGWGAEMLTSVGEARYNEYYHNSKMRKNSDRAGQSEAAMDGRDYEIGTHMPYVPALKFYAKYFEWDYGSIEDNGFTYTAELNTPYGVTISAGFTKFDNSKDEQPFVKISFNPSIKQNTKIMQEIAYDFKSVEDKKLTKVRRENKIKTIKAGFTISGI
jgi:adhesin/invasin